jgi:hypothetical protein
VDVDGNVRGLIDDTEHDSARQSCEYLHVSYCNQSCGQTCNPDGQPPPAYVHTDWCNGTCGEQCATVSGAPVTPVKPHTTAPNHSGGHAAPDTTHRQRGPRSTVRAAATGPSHQPPAPAGVASAAGVPPPAPESQTQANTGTVVAHWRANVTETNPKTGKVYTNSYLEIDESLNMTHLQLLRKLKQYGNRPGGPGTVPGLKSGGQSTGKVGFTRTWHIKVSEIDLHHLHGSLDAFIATFASKSADMNNGTPVQLAVQGITALPPLKLKLVLSGTQVGIQGATYLASKFFDIKMLGSNAANGNETFSWESGENVYACNMPWARAHVRGLLETAIAQHMPGRDMQVVDV